MKFYIVGAILICCISCTHSYTYKALLRNVDIYNPCENQPENVLDVHGLFDLSKLHTEFDNNGEVIVSGNITAVWDIQPTDLIKAHADVLRFDRGSWVPTQYSVDIQNMCLVLFIKNDFWYDTWIKHVINADKIRNKCFQRGTQYVHERFPLQLRLPTRQADLEGYFKVLIKLHAFAIPHQVRPTSICFEIKGDLERE